MSLNAFLAAAEGDEAAATDPKAGAAAPEPEARQPEPAERERERERAEPEPEPERERAQPEDRAAERAAPEPAEGEGGDAPAEGEPEDLRGLRQALHSTRRDRSDHKGRADRLEGEMASMRAQLEALQKAPPAPAAPPPPPPAPAPPPPPPPPVVQPMRPMPSPIEDPEGWQSWMQDRDMAQRQELFNERLNNSEAMLRSQYDDADVDAKMEVFKAAAAKNSALGVELARQPHPWRYAYQTAQRLMAMEEIGTDPGAYKAKTEAELRTKLEAEIREKLEGEMREREAEFSRAVPGVAAPAVPRAAVPSSLGTARSAGPRSVAVEQAPSFAEVFDPKRKR